MTGGSDWVLDKKYGRQGGRRTKHEPVDTADAPHCTECHRPMLCDQPGQHWTCSPTCDECHRPIGPKRQNCHCKTKATG
jgi:hypothetical protein